MQRKEQAAKTKMAIYSAACRLFEEESPDHVTIRDICKAANVSTGAFYHHFPDKDALLLLYYNRVDNYSLVVSTSLDATSALSALERLVLYFVGLAQHIVNGHLRAFTRSLLVQLRSPKAKIYSRDRAAYQTILQYYRQAQEEGDLQKDSPAEWVCDLLMASFRGLWIHWGSGDVEYDLVERAEFNVRLILSPFRTAKQGTN